MTSSSWATWRRAHAARHQLAEVLERRLAGRQRELRKTVSEVLQCEAEPQGELARVGERIRKIVEEPHHLPLAPDPALAVHGEEPAGVIEVGLLADAREDVGEQPPLRPRVERLARGDERDPRRARERHQALEHPLLLALEMALDLHVAARPAEDRDESLQGAARARHIAGVEPQR